MDMGHLFEKGQDLHTTRGGEINSNSMTTLVTFIPVLLIKRSHNEDLYIMNGNLDLYCS